MDTGHTATVLRLKQFEPACAAGPNLQNLERRYSTLLVEESSSPLHGGMSYICRATTTDGAVVAVKRQLKSSESDPDLARAMDEAGEQALFQEYKSLLAVSGEPGFPRIYGYGISDDGPLILMEWIEGKTLRSAAPLLPHEGGGVAGSVVCAIGTEVLGILLGASNGSRAIVHRDISARNIMIRTNARTLEEQISSLSFDLVLIDFGSATPMASQMGSLTAKTGLVRFGTPAYAPPEMLTADVAYPEEVRKSPRVDVYALCSVLYELYSGKTPYVADGSWYLEKRDHAPAPIVPHVEGDRPLCEAILSGIRADQEMRPSPQELKSALEAWQGKKPAPQRKDDATEEQKGQHWSLTRRAFFICLGGAAAGIAAVAAARSGILSGISFPSIPSASAKDDGGTEDSSASQDGSDDASSGDSSAAQTQVSAVAYAWPALDATSGLWGLLDASGSWVLEPSLSVQPGSWSQSGTPACDGSLWGFVGAAGSWLVSPAFKALGPLSADGYAAAQSTSGLWGIVSSGGSWAVEPSCLAMEKTIHNGMVPARQSSSADSWGFLATDGTWTISPGGFSALGSCGDNGLAAACVSQTLWGYLRTANRSWAIKPTLAEARLFQEGLAACRPNMQDSTYTLIDASGNRIAEGFADMRPFASSLAAAKDASTGSWGFIDAAGSWAVAPAFAALGDMHEGSAPAQDSSSGLWGLVDASGSWVMSPSCSQMALGDLGDDQPATT